jgi:hypothetical protein
MARPHSPTVRKAQAPADPALAFQDDALLNADPATINRTLDQMKAAGARNLRVNAIYGQSRANGAYDWSQLDTLVNAARARGISPQMTLMGTPEYMRARNLDMGLSAATPNQNLMGAFARDAATHFRGRVGRYSVWNEPNIASFLAEGENKAGPKQYRRLYQAGYKAIKGADPHAKVLLGELTAGRQGADPKAQALGFLRRVLAAGNKPLRADGLALHPYQWSDPNQKMNDANYGGISNRPMVQRELSREFHRGKLTTGGKLRSKVPLYLTEFGYKGAEMSPTTRAKYMRQASTLAQQAGAREMLWYQWLPTTSTQQVAQNAVQVPGNNVQVQDMYGAMHQRPGPFSVFQPGPRTVVTQGGPWDTSIADASGRLLPQFVNALRPRRPARPRARAAKVRRKRG